MKKNLLLVTMALLGYLTAFGQNPSWSIGNNNFYAANNYPLPIPQFDYGNPTMSNSGNQNLGYQGQLATNASNMITDASGGILFFIVDHHIYNKQGYCLGNLTSNSDPYSTIATSSVRGASEIVIVPNPSNCQQYYIISTRVNVNNYEKVPFVFLLDMSLPNYQAQIFDSPDCVKGELVPIGNNNGAGQNIGLEISTLCTGAEGTPLFIDPNDPSPGKSSNVFIGASNKNLNNEHFVFISNPKFIFRFKISSAGFTFDNYAITLPIGPLDYNAASVRSELEIIELANGNYRIACPYFKSQNIGSNTAWEWLYTAELNSSGNLIPSTDHHFPFFKDPNSQTGYTDAALKGLEFSGDGNILYVTHSTNSVQPNQLEYFNFNNPTVSLVPLAINPAVDAKFSLLERDVNNSIYFTGNTGMYKLNNANTPSTALVQVTSAPGVYNLENNGTTGFFSDLYKLYMLPDQIDKMNYSAYLQQNLQCCIASSFFNRTDIINVTTGGIWQDNSVAPGSNPLIIGNGTTAYIKESIYIKPGVTLTIKNMTLKFAPDARIVVENGSSTAQGGKLILDGATLTVDDRCDPNALWWGCEVWGNQNLSQENLTNSNQGRLEMKTNATIEHAKIGVLVGKRQSVLNQLSSCIFDEVIYPTIFMETNNGGIITINKSYFKNNLTGIMMRKYLPSSGAINLSTIKTSDFIWDNSLHGSIVQNHINLQSVKGITIQADRFINSNTLQPILLNAGTGVFSTNAGFNVVSKCNVILPNGVNCTSYTPCQFDGLYFGVNAYNSINNLTFTVNRSNFVNCKTGVFVVGTKNERITENYFTVPELTSATAGIYTLGSTGYKIEQNQFDEASPTTIGQTYGAIIRNSGTPHNEVYNNTFYNLNIGGLSEYKNGTPVPGIVTTPQTVSSTGLQWLCNIFKSPIAVTDLGVVGTSLEPGIVDYHQGYLVPTTLNGAINGAARNQFSMFGETSPVAHDIKLDQYSQQLNYVHLFGPIQTPDNVSPQVSVSQQMFSGNAVSETLQTHCPSKLLTKPTIFNIINFKHQSESLQSLVDGGNTVSLLNQLSTSQNPHALVSSYSPYLSDEVLVAFIGTSATNEQKRTLLLANAPFTQIVSQAINASTLPQSTKTELLSIAGMSSMQKLAIEISEAKSTYEEAYSNLLSQLLVDTLVQKSEIVDFLTGIESDQSKMDLTELYISYGDNNSAQSLMADLASKYPDFVQFCELNIAINGYISVEEAFSLNSDLRETALLLAATSHDSRIKEQAQTLVDYMGNILVFPDVLPFTGSKMPIVNEDVNSKVSMINMYPNPSTGLVSFSLEEMVNTIDITVFDINGRAVYSTNYRYTNSGQIDLSNLNKGLYLVEYKINDMITEVKKLEMK